MDMQNWKSVISNNGGYEKIAKMIFDNGSTWNRDPNKTFAEQVTMDEANEAWVFTKANSNGWSINGKTVASVEVRDNNQLTLIAFIQDVDDMPRLDKTW